MKIRKRLILALVFLVTAFCAASAGVDLVVMVDTSASMFPIFGDVVNYLLRDILENRLRAGDTFHLLSFAGSVEEETTESIAETSNLEQVVGRILLLHPLGRYTDLIGALESLYDYVSALPEENRKLVLLLTDGIHDPPPDSPNRLGAEETLQRLLANTERIRREGWEIRILRIPTGDARAAAELPAAGDEAAAGPVPGTGEATGIAAGEKPEESQEGRPAAGPAGGQNLLEELTEGLQIEVVEMEDTGPSGTEALAGRLTGFATVSFPGDLGEVSRRLSVPLTVTNNSDAPLLLTLTAIYHAERNLLEKPVEREIAPQSSGEVTAPVRVPASIPPGAQRLPVRLVFSDPELRISPLRGEIVFTYAPPFRPGRWLIGIPRKYLLYGSAALVLIVLVVLLILLLRNRLADASFARFYGGGKRGRRRGKPIIMRVRDQNSQIGSRNIHRVPPKRALSVGGDGSAFLIYFVHVPRRIGELRNDGKRFVFTPKKLDYFVELTEPLQECLGKEIRAVSSRGYPVTFAFHEYVSPLEELNRLMRSIHYEAAQLPTKKAKNA
jgi:hypothetical protein